MFDVSDGAQSAQATFAKMAIKELGPVKGHTKSIDKALWDIVVGIEDESCIENQDFLNSALEEIEKKSYTYIEIVKPCLNVKIPQNIKEFKISEQIRICNTESVLEYLNSKHKKVKFTVYSGLTVSPPNFGVDGTLVSALPRAIWIVNLIAADPLKGEESLWLVDVALSVLRFSVSGNGLGPLTQRVGLVESHPFEQYSRSENSITLTEQGVTLGGSSIGGFYELTDNAILEITQKVTQQKIAVVMKPEAGTLAERFHQGCGWLTRARRSSDRSERILYIFTALEALLSDNDKSAPVVQTISRNASCLFSNEIEERIEISNGISKLYAIRSALVHSGKRSAGQHDVIDIESIVVIVFQKVWDEIDLNLKHQEFVRLMKIVGFGYSLEKTFAK